MLRRTLLLSLTLMTFSMALMAGGGWVKSLGTGYYKLGQAWTSTVGYFDGAGGFATGLEAQLYTTSLYTEHGIGEGVSIEAYLPLYVRNTAQGTIIDDDMMPIQLDDAAAGIGDANLGLRVSLLKRDFFAWSGTFTLGIPLGSPTLGEQQNLFTGDGEYNQIVRTDMSAPFGTKDFGGYATVYAGYNFRSTIFVNEALYGAEIGLSAFDSRAWLIGRFNATDIGKTEPGATFGVGPVNAFAASVTFKTYMIETAFKLNDQLGISASYTGLITGNILLVDETVAFGLYYDIK